MSIPDYMMFPDDYQQMVQAMTWHVCEVVDVKDESGSNFIRVKCPSLYGEGKSNWLPVSGMAQGSNSKSRSHTGFHNPPQPGSSGFIFFSGGNIRKPTFMPGQPWMESPGNPGNSRA